MLGCLEKKAPGAGVGGGPVESSPSLVRTGPLQVDNSSKWSRQPSRVSYKRAGGPPLKISLGPQWHTGLSPANSKPLLPSGNQVWTRHPWFLPTISAIYPIPPPWMTWKTPVPSLRCSPRFPWSEKPFMHISSPSSPSLGSGLSPLIAPPASVQTSLRLALSWAKLCSSRVMLESWFSVSQAVTLFWDRLFLEVIKLKRSHLRWGLIQYGWIWTQTYMTRGLPRWHWW